MKEGPDITLIGSLIGDPARANMLNALMGGIALTATELAKVAGISAQTASSHLKKLEEGGLLKLRKQGRHRYFCLADDEVALVIERLIGLAERKGHVRVRTGPKDSILRHSRICYDHLAGDMGVQLYDSLVERNLLQVNGDGLSLTQEGIKFIEDFGINLDNMAQKGRPLCNSCLDWSVRRSHLSGALGASLLNHFFELGWVKRETDSRVLHFSRSGKIKFEENFPVSQRSRKL
ncbi:MAG: ArsR/SmtB family transcription factor [Terasakiella sp.]|uniref:ArsR/SmtB family transcription factor n=1 Tax=unclassified Terasakiella TaxID=2614952 RepID=UPI003B006213